MPFLDTMYIAVLISPNKATHYGSAGCTEATTWSFCYAWLYAKHANFWSDIGHIVWMPDKSDAKQILTASPLENWGRPPGCPSYYVDEDYPAEPEINVLTLSYDNPKINLNVRMIARCFVNWAPDLLWTHLMLNHFKLISNSKQYVQQLWTTSQKHIFITPPDVFPMFFCASV